MQVVQDSLNAIELAKWQLGVITHHDAITGTSNRLTTKDYQENCENVINKLGYTLMKSLLGYRQEITGFLVAPVEVKISLLSEYGIEPQLNEYLDRSSETWLYVVGK